MTRETDARKLVANAQAWTVAEDDLTCYSCGCDIYEGEEYLSALFKNYCEACAEDM